MRRRLSPPLAAAAALLAAGPAALPAAAQQADRPPTSPTRDVAVTYRLGGAEARTGESPQEMRLAWLAAEQRMRLDMPGQGYMVIDQRDQRAFMVMEDQRMVMEIPFAQNTRRMGQLPPGARLTREGQDRVAGTPCTVWSYQEGTRTGRSCITEDGVVLRVQGPDGPEDSMEARAVAYGPQDPARFRPPADYTVLSMPAGMGAAMMPPPVAAGGPPGAGPPGMLPLAGAMPPGLLPPGAMPGRLPPAGTVGVASTSGSSSSSSSSAMASPPPTAQPRRSR